jgi:hypothetical protein
MLLPVFLSYNVVYEQQQVRTFIRLRLDIVGDMDSWPVAHPQVHEGHHNTPNPDNLALDWGTVGVTAWTRECIGILSKEFQLSHEKGVFPMIQHLKITADMVSSAMKGYMTYLKRQYVKTKENSDKAKRARAISDQRSRSLGRRQQVCICSI